MCARASKAVIDLKAECGLQMELISGTRHLAPKLHRLCSHLLCLFHLDSQIKSKFKQHLYLWLLLCFCVLPTILNTECDSINKDSRNQYPVLGSVFPWPCLHKNWGAHMTKETLSSPTMEPALTLQDFAIDIPVPQPLTHIALSLFPGLFWTLPYKYECA